MEKSTRADQLDHPALRLLAARPDFFARQGHIAAGWRYRNGKTFGPYYRLAYRDENGRQHSMYLGRSGELVDQIRRRLDALQRPRTEHRQIRRLERQVRVSLRLEKQHLNALLRRYGLRLQGFEVRGWRLSPLRRFLPLRRRFPPHFSLSGIYPNVPSPFGRGLE